MKRHPKPVRIEIDRKKCDLCGACSGVCPKNVINIVHNSISIDFTDCILCILCIDICPFRAIKVFYPAENAA